MLLPLITQGYFCQTSFIENRLIFNGQLRIKSCTKTYCGTIEFLVPQFLCILWGPLLVNPKNLCPHQHVNKMIIYEN